LVFRIKIRRKKEAAEEGEETLNIVI